MKSGAKVFFCIKCLKTLMLTARYVGKSYLSLLSGRCCCLNITKLRCKERNYRNGLIKRPLQKCPLQLNCINPIQYGLFKNTTVWGALCPSPLVTLLFLKVKGQNLVAWGILMCFLKKWH